MSDPAEETIRESSAKLAEFYEEATKRFAGDLADKWEKDIATLTEDPHTARDYAAERDRLAQRIEFIETRDWPALFKENARLRAALEEVRDRQFTSLAQLREVADTALSGETQESPPTGETP